MTMEMILALGILVLMIVLIMSDKMPFGAPPLLACLLLVVSKRGDDCRVDGGHGGDTKNPAYQQR